MIPLRDRNPSGTFPAVTVALIVINVLVFFREVGQNPRQLQAFVETHGLRPALVTEFLRGGGAEHEGRRVAVVQDERGHRTAVPFDARWVLLPLFTSMFLHGGWLHLIGNLWYLWIFGDNVEDRLGHLNYALFYLLCGLGAAVVHVAFNAGSAVPTVGASGAIAGVLGAYLVAFPRAQVATLVPILIIFTVVWLPAVVVLGFWFVIQLVSGMESVRMVQTGGVAWWAHIGGFVFGMLFLFVFQKAPERRRIYAYYR